MYVLDTVIQGNTSFSIIMHNFRGDVPNAFSFKRYSLHFKYKLGVWVSVLVIVDTSGRSPRKLFIFVIKNNNYGIKASQRQ